MEDSSKRFPSSNPERYEGSSETSNDSETPTTSGVNSHASNISAKEEGSMVPIPEEKETAESLDSRSGLDKPSPSEVVRQFPSPQLRYRTCLRFLPTSDLSQKALPSRRTSLPAPFITETSHDTAEKLTFLELTLNMKLPMDHVVKYFEDFMRRQMRIVTVTSIIKLLIFVDSSDAQEALLSPCHLGKIVSLKEASIKSQEEAKNYNLILSRRKSYLATQKRLN